MEKLKHQLAEAEEALEARKKPPEDTGPRVVGEGLVIDEWVNNSLSLKLLYVFLNFQLHCLNVSLCFASSRKKEGKDIWHDNRLKGLIPCKICGFTCVS